MTLRRNNALQAAEIKIQLKLTMEKFCETSLFANRKRMEQLTNPRVGGRHITN